MPKKPPQKKKSRQQTRVKARRGKTAVARPKKATAGKPKAARSQARKPVKIQASQKPASIRGTVGGANNRPRPGSPEPVLSTPVPEARSAGLEPPGRRIVRDPERRNDEGGTPRATSAEQRARIEGERQAAIDELRRLGLSPDLDEAARGHTGQVVEDGDAAQASETRDMSFARRERLAARINALTQALERIARGDYGRCEECGGDIEPQRLQALPTARTCINCQQQRERAGGRQLSL